MLNDFGIPTLSAIVRARKTLDKLGAKQELLVGGGLNKGSDIAKALALGADAVFMGFALLVAMGCMYCRQCFRGTCPKGITTQTPRLRKNLHINKAAKSISNFLNCCNEEVKMAAAATGKCDVHKLDRHDLRAKNINTSKITGVELV